MPVRNPIHVWAPKKEKWRGGSTFFTTPTYTQS